MNKIRISNDELWELAINGIVIDDWLKGNIGIGNYVEHFGLVNLPYRSFSFAKDEDATWFMMKFGGNVHGIN